MADRNRSHIVVQGRVTAEDYTRRARSGGDEIAPRLTGPVTPGG